MFNFNPKKIQFNNPYAKGPSGSIYPYGEEDKNNTKWMVKWINALNFEKVLKVMEEIVVGYNLEHPAILPLRGYKVEATKPKGWNIYMKMPRMATDFRKIINRNIENNQSIPEKDLIFYFHSLVSGLEYLHNRRIPHTNIKPENVLISKQGIPKFSGTGASKFRDLELTFHTSTEAVGEQAYIAPELLEIQGRLKKKHLVKADMWSLGAVFGELCLLKRIPSGIRENDIAAIMKHLEGKYNQTLLELFANLLGNPEERKTAAQVREVLELNFLEVLQEAQKQHQEEGNEIEFEDSPSKVEESKRNILDITKSKGNSEILEEGPESPNLRIMSLNMLKKDMKKRWQETLVFDPNEQFFVKSLNKKADDANLREFMAEIKKEAKQIGLPHLEKCEFNLGGCREITDKGVREFTIDITESMAKLKDLSLSLESCMQITDQGLKDLSTYVSTGLIHLQRLSLNLAQCTKLTNEGIKEMSFNLAYNLDLLEYLNLNLKGTKITDSGVHELTAPIGQNLKELKSVNFNFAFCSEVGDQGIAEISAIGLENPNFQELSLNFTSCHIISDKGLTQLGQHIGNKLRKIQKLSLNFDSCSKITDAGLKALATPIGVNCRGLLELDLNFTSCSLLTDSGIKNFAGALGESLRNLNELSLKFTTCNNLSDSGVKNFASVINANSVNLLKITLSFAGCYKVSQETKTSLKSVFSLVKNIIIE